MEKEYLVTKVLYIDGERFDFFVSVESTLDKAVKLYNKLMRKKRMRFYSIEIQERTVSDWMNIDYDNVLGFNLTK